MAAIGYKALRPPTCPYPVKVADDVAPSQGWLATPCCDCATAEIAAMSALCTPCQFAITHARTHARTHADGQPWLPYAVTYLAHLLGYQLLVLALTTDPTAIALSGLCGHVAVGTYAGGARTRLREKYGIPGDTCLDCLLHTFAAPCAVAQEASHVARLLA